VPRNDWQRAKNFLERQRNSDDSCGTNKQFLWRTAKPLRSFRHPSEGGGMARFAGSAVGVPAFTTTARMRPFDARKFCLENEHGCGNDEVFA